MWKHNCITIIHEIVPKWKPLLSKNNTKACLTIAKNILMIQKMFENIQRYYKSWTFWKICTVYP